MQDVILREGCNCFIKKCLETVTYGIMEKTNLAEKYLSQFSINNPAHRAAVQRFLKDETHFVLPTVSRQCRADFVRLYAVLYSQRSEDEKPKIVEAIEMLTQGLSESIDLLRNVKSATAQQLFAIGVWTGDFELIISAMGGGKSLKFKDQLVIPADMWRQEELAKLRNQYNFGCELPNGALCALVLTALWCGDEEIRKNVNGVIENAANLFMVKCEPDYDEVARILKVEGCPYSVKDYTQSIRSGADLYKRMNDCKNGYFELNTCGNNPINTFGMSTANAVRFPDMAGGRSTMAVRINYETVNKNDRMMALRCAYAQYGTFHSIKVWGTNLTDCNYDRFNALNLFYGHDEILKNPDRKNSVLFQELGNEKNTKTVFKHLDALYNRISAWEFEKTYLTALYTIVTDRICYSEILDELSDEFFGESTVKVADFSDEEVQRLYASLDSKDKEIEKLNSQIKGLEEKLDSARQAETQVSRKNSIIADLRKEVAELRRQLANERGPSTLDNESAVSLDSDIADEISGGMPYEQVHEELLDLCQQYKVVMVDGHENFHRRLAEVQPNIKMIPGDHFKQNEGAVSTADFVLCKSQAYGSHSIMEKAQSLIRERKDGKTHFIYLSKITNIEQSEREIYDAIISCLSGGMSNAG